MKDDLKLIKTMLFATLLRGIIQDVTGIVIKLLK